MEFKYEVYGLGVSSTFDLGIPTKHGIRPALQLVIMSRFKRLRRLPATPSYLVRGETHFLRIPDFGQFSFRGRRLCLRLDSPQDREDIQAAVLNQGIPFALTCQGEILLHAAAIWTRSGAVLFAGPSGMGKSNLAALYASRGHKILSDNLVRLDQKRNRIYPAFPEIRLFAKDLRYHRSLARRPKNSFAKRRLAVGARFHARPTPLKKIYFIQKSKSNLRFHSLRMAEKFSGLLSNATLYTTASQKMDSQRYARLIRLAQEIPMERLSLPHRRNAEMNLDRMLRP